MPGTQHSMQQLVGVEVEQETVLLGRGGQYGKNIILRFLFTIKLQFWFYHHFADMFENNLQVYVFKHFLLIYYKVILNSPTSFHLKVY